jgi:predicted transposase YdaD
MFASTNTASVFGFVVPWRGLYSPWCFISIALCFLFKLIETIVIYKLPEASREEIAQMLGITDLKQTRFYQEAFLEGQEAEQRKLIRRLRDRNYSPEDIAQLLDVSVEEVQRSLT